MNFSSSIILIALSIVSGSNYAHIGSHVFEDRHKYKSVKCYPHKSEAYWRAARVCFWSKFFCDEYIEDICYKSENEADVACSRHNCPLVTKVYNNKSLEPTSFCTYIEMDSSHAKHFSDEQTRDMECFKPASKNLHTIDD